MSYLLGENDIDLESSNWKQLYEIISLLRYRNPVDKTTGQKDTYLRSHKSKLKLIKQ
jgi:hypothetical protein